MIISASRRTDIPAFYQEWFFNRIKEGYLMVRNPMNLHQVSKISLSPDVVDCIVFWTKNPEPMLKRLPELDKYNYYFQFTLNPYDTSIEENVPGKKSLIKTFQKLSEIVGRNRVVWRYDPILLSDKFNADYHKRWFEYLAQRLSPYTDKCIISFIDMYKKIARNMKEAGIRPINQATINDIATYISYCSVKYDIKVETCSEDIELERYNISHGACIDESLITHMLGKRLNIRKERNQRSHCGCAKSIDIGAYNTCTHNCLYCYANNDRKYVDKNVMTHNKNSPLLFGKLGEKDKVFEKTEPSYIDNQMDFWE